jgi:predicted ATP-dependent Lon-type protease
MLKDIITSRVRVKILQLLLSKSEVMFHVREIVRRTNEEINAVRRELSHMEKAGMVGKEPRANRLFYFFRKTYPLYFELMELVAKSSGIGGEIIKNKAKLGKLKYVMLSGRYLRGLPKKENGVDILVVGTVVLPELAQIIRTEEAQTGKEINYTVMTEDEYLFRHRRRDPFILDVISSSRLMIIGDEENLVTSK